MRAELSKQHSSLGFAVFLQQLISGELLARQENQ
jgi:hypothetical protein